MKTMMFLFLSLTLAACASRPAAESAAPEPLKTGTVDTAAFSALITDRTPAGFTEEETYRAFKFMIFTSTEIRRKALYEKNIAVICNASGSKAGIDTMPYYLAFEALLNRNNSIATRIRQDAGPFGNSNLVSIAEGRLANKLHQACIKGSVASQTVIGKDPAAVIAAMRAIDSTMALE